VLQDDKKIRFIVVNLELCVLTWYSNYRLTPIFDHAPILFFLVHSFVCIFNHNQNQNAHKCPLCVFFLRFSHPSTFSHLVAELFLFSYHVSLSLSKWHPALPFFALLANTTHPILSCWKKNAKRGFMPIVDLISTGNFGQSSYFQSKLPMSKFRPY
jgi:hypothetical protein